MEQIIDFILSNLFIIVILISALVGFFNNQQKGDPQDERRRERRPGQPPRPAPARQREQRTPRPKSARRMQPAEPVAPEPVAPEPVAMETVEEQQQRQMDRLAENLRTSSSQAIDDISGAADDVASILQEVRGKSLQQEREELRRRVRSDLRGKQLMNGIIMAEILGPPRAVKPYRSIVNERRNK